MRESFAFGDDGDQLRTRQKTHAIYLGVSGKRG